MFDVRTWLIDIESSCGKRGCKATVVLPCDNIEGKDVEEPDYEEPLYEIPA
jgi:hypothetical protein